MNITCLRLSVIITKVNVLFLLSVLGDPASKSSAVEWKEGKNLLEMSTSSQAANGKKKYSGFRTFFQWYMDNTDPSADDVAEVFSCSKEQPTSILI